MDIQSKIIEFQKAIREYRHQHPQYYSESELCWRQVESLLTQLHRSQGPTKFHDTTIAKERFQDLKNDDKLWHELSRRIQKNNPALSSTEAMKEASQLMDDRRLRL